jgi:hypothetical protein
VLIGPSIRGAMAQLVARLVRNEKVRGSSPLSSTVLNMVLTRSFVLLLGKQDCTCILAFAPSVPNVELLGPGNAR